MNKGIDRPSPLDGPRFFEDSTLSEFTWDGKRAVGTRQDLQYARPYVRNETPNAPTPTPRSLDDPISIELVRGSDGHGGDEWVVLVDGLRCPLKRPDGKTSGSYKCVLPPGVSRNFRLSKNTKVRPVAIAIRLEDEARLPMLAQMKIFQTLRTDERYVQEENTDTDPTQVGNTVELRPYRVSDISATAAVIPYPFWSPAQSCLGILSLNALQRWEEQENYIMAYNIFSQVYNGAVETVNSARSLAFTKLKEANNIQELADVASTQVVNLTNRYRSNTVKEEKESELKELRARLVAEKPVDIDKLRVKSGREKPQGNDVTKTFVIGGKTQSAPHELAELFRVLTRLTKQVNAEVVKQKESGKSLSLSNKLSLLRHFIYLQRDSTLVALFDAIFTSRPYPPTEAYLDRISLTGQDSGVGHPIKRFFKIKECAERKKKQAADREELRRKMQANVDAEQDLLYNGVEFQAAAGSERLLLEATQAEAVTEFGESGAAASSGAEPEPNGDYDVELTSDFNVDVMDKEARQAFSDQISKNAAASFQSEIDAIRESAPEYMFTYDRLPVRSRTRTTLRMSILVEVIDYDEQDNLSIEFEAAQDDGVVAHAIYSNLISDIEKLDLYTQEFINELFVVHIAKTNLTESFKEGVANLSRFIKGLPFVGSQRRVEKSNVQARNLSDMAKLIPKGLANIFTDSSNGAPFKFDICMAETRIAELRIMSREILPLWPPRNDTSDISSTSVDIDTLEAEAVANAQAERRKSVFNDDDKKRLRNEILTLANDKADAIRKSNMEITNDVALFDQNANDQQETKLLRRTLPQIVKPGQTPVLQFSKYADMDPPEEDLVFEQEGFRYGFGAILSSFASVLSAPTFSALATAASTTSVGGLSLLSAALVMIYTTQFTRALANQKFQEGTMDSAQAVSITFMSALIDTIQNKGPSRIIDPLVQLAGSTVLGALFESNILQSIGSPSYVADLLNVASASLPLAYNTSNMIFDLANRRYKYQDAIAKALRAHRKQVRAKPAASAIVAANSAVSAFKRDLENERRRFGILEDISVVYTTTTSTRFFFHEYYEVTHSSEEMLGTLPLVNSSLDWLSVPDSNAMRLLPPQDVVDALFEAESLRGMHTNDAVSFTAGIASSSNLNTPSEMAAKSAHQEIVRVIMKDRRILKGEHLMQTAAEAAVNLAMQGSKILSETFGSKAGVTFVSNGDILWTCAKAGVATRLALRHLTLYHDAPRTENTKEVLKYWRRPRRVQVDAFAKAWVAEAQQFAKEQISSRISLPTMKQFGIEAVRRYERVKCLASDTDGGSRTLALSAVLSSVVHDLMISSIPGDDFALLTQQNVSVEQHKAEQFQDQVSLKKPESEYITKGKQIAIWASRRISVRQSRQAGIGEGVFRMTTMLSALGEMEGDTSVDAGDYPRVYYCPMGSKIQALPDKTQFRIDVLGNQVIWTDALANASDMVLNALTPEDGRSGMQLVLEATHLSKATGFARHPLTLVVASKNTVRVGISSANERVDAVYDNGLDYSNLSDVLSHAYTTDSNTFQSMQYSTKRMRTMAYNAERLMFAKYLSECIDTSQTELHVKLPDADSALALALGISMLEVQAVSPVMTFVVQVSEEEEAAMEAGSEVATAVATAAVDKARSSLYRLSSRMKKASMQGCKACSLAEVALCM